jgi:hypothetical protein
VALSLNSLDQTFEDLDPPGWLGTESLWMVRFFSDHAKLLAVIKCIYLPLTYLHFIQDIEYRCLLLMSSTSFVDLLFQEHWMMEKHHVN